jgi:heme/copper-type cytochrome/quinol oxidase subunit 2
MTGAICAKTLLVGFLHQIRRTRHYEHVSRDALLRTSEMVIIALVTASLATGGVLAVVLVPPPLPCSGVTGAIRSFTIIVDLTGYNGSQSHNEAWPVITVQHCDTVVFMVINRDTQAHGFAVASYSNIGLELVGGDSQKLQFQATRLGQFRIYCTSRCSVHYLMQNGLLNVT